MDHPVIAGHQGPVAPALGGLGDRKYEISALGAETEDGLGVKPSNHEQRVLV
jgi:hypothetical protein